MTPEAITDFLTSYIRSLSEETRSEAKGPRHGFDHIIYEIALAEDSIPTRLSFIRQGDGELSMPKKEPEHGVDAAFITRDGKTLTVFVLKDEVLNYRNWTEEKFDYDLRRARDQDLTVPELRMVTEVRIVLAYNKDDTEEGVESFERFERSSGTKIGDHAALRFERWNLTTITEKVKQSVLTPSLLPESFFRRFTYLCWQVGDFNHGSSQWVEVLLPDWREFLALVLTDPITERRVRLVSVALIILRSHGKKTLAGEPEPSFETGWIDLLEWAILTLWDAARRSVDKRVKKAVSDIWLKFYLAELERYYSTHIELLAAEHSIEIGGSAIQEGASSYIAYWHMGRLGILAMALGELSQLNGDAGNGIRELVHRSADWVVRLLNANPSCLRPLLDIHHIEIFLVWRAMVQCGRWNDALNWFQTLFERLLYRRLGKAGCRVIDYGNSWEALFEFLATDEAPYAGFGQSSYLLLMMMELCLGAPRQEGNGLASVMHSQLIHAQNGGGGEKLPFKEQVQLMGWIPPSNWSERILAGPVNDGVALPTHFSLGESDAAFPEALHRFIENSRKVMPEVWLPFTPPSTLVLACQKHVSALPSEFWRASLFGSPPTSANTSEEVEK